MKEITILIGFLIFIPMTVWAGYPMISDLSNQEINVNTSTPVIPFKVSDDKTPASQLVVTFQSSNQNLVPQDDDNVILGGQGSTRTVQVVPLPNRTGYVTITIIVTDTDGETNQDTFTVEVSRPQS